MRQISLSQARKSLSGLLHEIRLNPEVTYQIAVRNRVVAELKRPASHAPKRNSGAALLSFARAMEKLNAPKPRHLAVTSENYKEYLYGSGLSARPRRKK